jgi:hypothetical protein
VASATPRDSRSTGCSPEYSLERLFPDRLDQAAPLDDLPGEQSDLLLLR